MLFTIILICNICVNAYSYYLMKNMEANMPKDCNCTISKTDWRRVYTQWYFAFLVVMSLILLALLYSDMYGSLLILTFIMTGAIFISGAIYIYAIISLIDEWRSKGLCQCTTNMKLSQSLMYIWAITKGVLYIQTILILLIVFNSIAKTSKYLKKNLNKVIKHKFK